ncbi:MAG: F0F1 ATP synthase subunit epsilon [Gammaproteobacteria bacterium]
MQTATMRLDIVSAEQSIFTGQAEMVFATGTLGELGIAPGHTPLITSLKPGNIRALLPDQKEEIFYISGGMLEIQPYIVTVLADTAIRAGDIDEAAALEAKERAERLLAEKASDIDIARASSELAEAVAQIQAVRKLKKQLK